MQNTTTAIPPWPSGLRRLLVGSTPDGKHVELTFSGFYGWVEVGGEVVYRIQSSADRDIARLLSAFSKACRVGTRSSRR